MKIIIAVVAAVVLLSGTAFATVDWEAAYNDIAALAEKYRLMIPGLEQENKALKAELEQLGVEVDDLKTELDILDTQLDTPEFEYYENGNIKIQREYHEDGTLLSEIAYYEDGQVESETNWHDNGNKKSEETFHPNGNVKHYISWNENGTVTDENHNKSAEVSYDEDDNITQHVTFWYNGNKMKVLTYENGQEVHGIEWYPDGAKWQEYTRGANAMSTTWEEDGTIRDSSCKDSYGNFISCFN